MTDIEQREAARQFFYKWNGKGKEDEDARSYWIDFLQDILGVDRVTDRVDFEKKVVGRDGNTKRIDVYSRNARFDRAKEPWNRARQAAGRAERQDAFWAGVRV